VVAHGGPEEWSFVHDGLPATVRGGAAGTRSRPSPSFFSFPVTGGGAYVGPFTGARFHLRVSAPSSNSLVVAPLVLNRLSAVSVLARTVSSGPPTVVTAVGRPTSRSSYPSLAF
jgi:hypothetical protein